MKKINKLIPLMMIVPLLGACGNSNSVKSMKKPAFQAYAEADKVEASVFFDKLDEASEAAAKEHLDVDEATSKIKGLKTGVEAVQKSYQVVEYSATLKTGNKMSGKQEVSGEVNMKADNASLVAKSNEKSAQKGSSKGVSSIPDYGFTTVGEKEVLYLPSLPGYYDLTANISSSGSLESGLMFKDNKLAQVDLTNKTYELVPVEYATAEEQQSVFGQYIYQTAAGLFDSFVPGSYGSYTYDRYVKEKLFTSAYTTEADAILVTYSSGDVYSVTSKAEFVYQLDLANMKGAFSQEVTIEMKDTKTAATHKLVSKTYATSTVSFKKVSLKAFDLAKFTDLTVDA